MNQRLEATVHGEVQGVGFRWFVRRQAARLSVVGWVANETDGTVRVVAEGTPTSLALLLAQLRSGPDGAAVASVEERWLSPTGSFSSFDIRGRGHAGD